MPNATFYDTKFRAFEGGRQRFDNATDTYNYAHTNFRRCALSDTVGVDIMVYTPNYPDSISCSTRRISICYDISSLPANAEIVEGKIKLQFRWTAPESYLEKDWTVNLGVNPDLTYKNCSFMSTAEREADFAALLQCFWFGSFPATEITAGYQDDFQDKEITIAANFLQGKDYLKVGVLSSTDMDASCPAEWVDLPNDVPYEKTRTLRISQITELEITYIIVSPRETVAVQDKITLEAIRNIEMAAKGRFYVDEEGNAVYDSRFARR